MSSTPTTVTVSLADRSYPIHIGPGLIARAGDLIAPVLKQPRVHIISDDHVAAHYLAPLQASLDQAGIAHAVTLIPPGEASKTFATLDRVLNALLDARVERKTTIIALGGGVVGDLAGFAAAIVLRGINFIQIPTSLLAQVDSSVGGKTGVDTRQGKNLIGSFHQPRMVLADTDTLDTLPLRELRAGYAEVAKYGLIDRPNFWHWLQDNGTAVIGSPDHDRDATVAARTYAIAESCRAKADIVARDETESDVRALLNLGHTFGHAFETLCGYGDTLVHGEAVAIGMCIAFRLSENLGLCPQGCANRVRAHLSSLGLPTSPKEIDADFTVDALWDAMQGDKKVADGRITFVLAKDIGDSFLTREVEADHVRAALAQALNEDA
jgi:3-dehydroquinate synthase